MNEISDSGEKSKTPYSPAYVWYVIILLALVYTFNYLDRMALAVLAPLIKQDLDLTDAQLGLLVGYVFALFFALCGLPIARWADRGVRRDIVAMALVVWSGMTALSGAAQNFWHLLLTRMGVGAGEAGFIPPAQSMLCDYVPVERRPGAFAALQMGLFGGTMLGLFLAGAMGEVLGWRLTFVLLGLPGIALAIIVKITIREPVRGFFDVEKNEEAQPSLGEVIGVLKRTKSYRFLLLFVIANGFVQYGFNQWWPTYYTRVHEMTLSAAGAYLGLAIGLGSGIGLAIGGVLSIKLAAKNVAMPLFLSGFACILALPPVLISLFVQSSSTSIWLVGIAVLLWSVPNGPVGAAIYSAVTSSMRATTGAISVLLVAILGYGPAPLLVGFLSDIFTPTLGADALRYALLVPAVALPVMALAVFYAGQRLRDDILRTDGASESARPLNVQSANP